MVFVVVVVVVVVESDLPEFSEQAAAAAVPQHRDSSL